MDKLEALTLRPPSLIDAASLTVKGPCKFVPGIKIVGDVTFVNGAGLAVDVLGLEFRLKPYSAPACAESHSHA